MSMRIPVIDLGPLFLDDDVAGAEKKRIKVLEQVKQASEDWGFFQVLNHTVSPRLLQQVLDSSKSFFDLPLDEKRKLITPFSPIGFVNESGASGVVDRKEHLLFFGPENANQQHNAWPEGDQNFRCILDEMMAECARVSKLLTGILLESLGLPKNRAQDLYRSSSDTCIMPFYPAAPQEFEQEMVLGQHRDAGIVTVLFQLNGVPGLQVLKDGQWVTVEPLQNSLVVNIGDAMQVWSNGRYKSVMHRVAKQELDRYSLAYFHIPGVDTEIAPLSEFTIDEAPKYRVYTQGEYLKLRFNNRNVKNKDKEVTIEHYAI